MNLPRFLVGLLLVPALLTTGCQEDPKELASQSDTGLPTETISLAATGDTLPSVAIVSPANFAYFQVAPGDAADVTAQFIVSGWTYPALNKGVMFILDKDWDTDPSAPNQPLLITTDGPPTPGTATAIVLADIPPGQHTLTACLAMKVTKTYDGQTGLYWDYLDNELNQPGIQRACTNIVIKVSIVGCWPTVYSAAEKAYICDPDPTHAGGCCLDDNPCSIDNCSWQSGSNKYECRYGPVAGSCCQSDYECAQPQRCYRIDNPDTPLDDNLVNKCYECDYMSAVADAACDDQNKCTVDDCAPSYMCNHDPVVGPHGEPCCQVNADCDDKDPCTIDQCENVVNGQGFCTFHSYMDLSDTQITQYGYDPASFQGCCVIGKEMQYCTDHLVIVDEVLQQDACWNVACISNKCRYGKDPNPLCCNTGFECDDCAEYDSGTGECIKNNVCTMDLCVDNVCTFEWDPFHPTDEDCCQHNLDCDDGQPNTIDWCQDYMCYHEVDPLYCDLVADPPALCPAPPNPCVTYQCNTATKHCDGKPVAGCCIDNDDCDDGDYCSTDVCDPLAHTCSHEDIELIGGKKCCNVSTDCYDNKVCTTEACVSHQCRYGAVTVNPAECASGKCCNSNSDLNGNGSADDCEVANSCTPWQCSNHCCVPKTNLAAGQCITALDCEDGDPYTWNVCAGCTCGLNPPTVCDETHLNCNDNNACTIDSCDTVEKRCKYVPKPNCCVQQADCVPDAPDPCTNYQCIKSLNICQNSYVPDCCTSDTDAKCNDFDGCSADFCVNGKCRHLDFDTGCCTTAADCNDSKECTRDECIDNQCTHALLANAPDGSLCCETDGACTDTDACTQDMCINNKCANPAIPNCCYPDGQEAPMCEDGNPCTADWCVFGKCRHLGPNEAPESSHIPPNCCKSDADCEADDNVCTKEVCAPTGLCISEPIEPCRLQLPYCQSFNQGVWPPEFLGWKREDTQGAPALFNWEYSAKGPLGLDYHVRFNGLKYPLDEFDANLLSPAFDSHDAYGNLITDVTVQWENFLDLNQPQKTNLAARILPNGNLATGTVAWSTSTTTDLEASFESAYHHSTYMGDYFKVAFNVNALDTISGVPVYGGAAHINAWDIDSVCICAGQAPQWIGLETRYGLFLQDSEHFPLKAADPDNSSSLSFEALGAPEFVSIVNGGYDWQNKKWVADLVVSPVDEAALGEHTFTIRVSDGCLFADREITISVFLRGGYLVWVPEDVSPLHGQRIVDAIAAQGDQPTAKRQWQILTDLAAYPDLSVADGIFACLGVKGAAYQLVETRNAIEEAANGELKALRDRKEALVAALATYLEGGGRLYVEGGDTWYDDPATNLPDYMRIEATAGGVTRLDGPVAGGGFLRDLTPYAYNQLPYNPSSPDNFWNNFLDRIKVKEHTRGRVFLENTGSLDFPVTVGYCDDVDCVDGSDAYRTIGSSIPFGGLENGGSTRVDLMAKYLYFFEHGLPSCDTTADCDDGQECTTDNCSGSPVKRCSNNEQLNCVYCLDDLDCDQAFPTLDYACHTSEVCKPLPGYMVHSGLLNSPFDIYAGSWQSPIATSVITLGGAGAEAWEDRNVAQVAAKLQVTHDYIGEVEITLAHGNQSVKAKLADLTKFGGTYFFTTSEAWGRPAAQGSMDQFEGGAIEGDWTLTVRDTKPANTKDGKLIQWWLFVAPDDVNCLGNPTACEDSNACTVDACLGGFCKNSPLVCSDIDPLTGNPNLCTTDGCDPATGCTYEQKICDDGNDCSLDLCDTATGECYHEWPDECWNPCTQHSDCGHLQYCKSGHCEIIPGVVYDSPVTGSEGVVDNGAAQVYPLNIPLGSDKDSLGRAVEDRVIHKLRVKVMTTHEDVADLEVKLIRGTTEYMLKAENAGTGQGRHWVFASNDEADFDVPATNLDDAPNGFVGKDIVGDWKLSIQDKQLGNTGTIDGWVLFMIQRHCLTNADCDDSSQCTADLCTANTTGDAKEQTNIPKVCANSADTECDDGLWCNGTEFCHPDTGCVDGEPPKLDDGIACTDDLCDEYNDEVYHLANETYCNDDNPCTTDVCDADCSDGTCGCQHLNNTDACDDGVYCTDNDRCTLGECTGTPTNAKPGCTCNVTNDCSIISNTNRCAGSYICNTAVHTCVIDPTTEVDCSTIPGYVNDPCAKHLCDPQDGECKVAFLAQGVLCEDGDLCTQNDLCNGTGQCLGVGHVCDDGYWCNGDEVCDPLTGQCVAPDVVCDVDGCQRPEFDDQVACTIDVCDSDNQQIHHFPDDTACDNGAFCDGLEVCNPAQGCQDGPNPNCEDYNPCTVNKCDEAAQACDFHDHVQHCSWPCDGDHLYDAGDDDCGYDDACVGGAGATAGSCQPVCGASCYTARSISPNAPELGLAIPDNDEVNCLERTLSLTLPPNLRFVERVEARVQVAHTSIVDLRVSLTDPDGYTVKMWENAGGSRDDFSNTFEQSWPETFRPMCAFRGDTPSGDWKLKVCDVLPQSQGTLEDWTLYVKGSETDTNLGDRCDNALAMNPEGGTAIGPNEWTQTLSGSTACAQEDHLASCGGGGKERVYRFHLNDHKLLNANVNSGGRNWVLHVKGATPSGTDCIDTTLACGAAPAGGAATIVDLKLAPGDYFFFVDSNGDYGDYAVSLTFKTLLENGGTCDHMNDCISAYCTDSTCCDKACDGLCEACDGLETAHGVVDRGTCTYIADGRDPEEECQGDDEICGWTCFYDTATGAGGDCKKPGTDTPHVKWQADQVTFGGICQRCDGNGDWEYIPHGTDPFLQCPNRACDGARLFYEQRCSNDEVTFPDRIGTCDCFDEKYGVFGCEGDLPHVADDWCPNGYMCDPTDGPDDDPLPDDCRTACTSQSHCQYGINDGPPAGWYCEERVSEDGFHECKQRKDLGLTCNAPEAGVFEYGECILNGALPYPCIDGVCCNTSCSALCMRCDGVDTLNGGDDIGTCTFAAEGKDPDVECRTDDTTNCGIGWCDGIGTCDWWDPDTTCVGQGDGFIHSQSCGRDNNGDDVAPSPYCQADGTHCEDAPDWILFPADTCSGDGYCLDAGGVAQTYANCRGGLMCNADQTDCLTMCESDADCSRPWPTDCDGDGGVNYYCREASCNPAVCKNWMDPTTNGSQATPTASFGSVHYSLGGTPEGAGACSGANCSTAPGAATKSDLGFYPPTRAIETPLQYRN